jgi:hypothetical protein
VPALNVYTKFNLKTKLFLLTPFLFLPDRQQAENTLKTMMDTYPEMHSLKPIEDMLINFEVIHTDYNPLSNLKKCDRAKVVGFVAKKDEIIPSHLLENIFNSMTIPYFSQNSLHAHDTGQIYTQELKKNVFFEKF